MEYYESTHRYAIDGRELMSVTRALKLAGLIWEATDAEALARGRAVHAACQYFDQGDLDWESLDERVKPYVLAWVKFREEIGFIVIPKCIEHRVYDSVYGFAGRLDRVGTLPRLGDAILDIKTGEAQPFTALQLAAYQRGLERESPVPVPFFRLAVVLKPDGSYMCKEFPRAEWREDLKTFYAALRLAKWKEEHHVRATPEI